MTEPTNGLPEPRTLFRSPPRAARDTPMSSTAQDVVTEAVAAQSTVDLCSKHAVRRALSRVLDDVWRAGTRGLRSGGLANVQAVLRIVGEAARAGSYTQEQVAEVAKLIVSLDDDSLSDDDDDPRQVVFDPATGARLPTPIPSPVAVPPVQLSLPQELLDSLRAGKDKDADKGRREAANGDAQGPGGLVGWPSIE